MKKQGSYDAFKLEWHPVYDLRRLKGAKTRVSRRSPIHESEADEDSWMGFHLLSSGNQTLGSGMFVRFRHVVLKTRRIEAVCYFLSSPDGKDCSHKAEFDACLQELVDMIEKAQQPDGYLNIYFTVVDPEGRFKNMRDMHEQC
jgi:hypothetical protein